ncbi:putative LLM family oxidoreductase [Okibacterium sp. HSC-33S16]|uniref:LLM class flavin-dependent oxidoreductase n=1 Tax=Okibacterium sp. HSC-33S16 TaxID=2910965 RepID=UPI00209E90C1|nr:LLM class flavin-dependent oxidoreductase [Okibacterium sp. HSC-33S16]MCP2031110.1 putative LLM family oxidoreductase [Okibacterium sp. HSC-33S16]
MAQQLELGLDTFGDVTVDSTGTPESDAKVIRNVIAQAVLADSVGVDFIGIGEHHRDDFSISAPDMVLAAIAGQTERIRLGTAVTVLSSDDPIRVFERFSTLDAASNGRAEVILGRGSFTESFPLFGFDLADYEALFNEKLDLFVQLLKEETFSWSGSYRAPLVDADVHPKTESGRLKSWIGVGGSPESVVRSVRTGIPMMLAIIGGDPGRFLPYVELYGRASDQLGLPRMPLGAHSPGHIAETDELAREQLWPHFKLNRDRIGAERGWPPVTETEFVHEVEHGSLYAGSPETVAQRIAKTARTLGLDRFDLKYANGPMPHDQLMKSIELYGTQVIPRVRELLA